MQILCTNGVKSVLLELIPAFERARDAKLAVTWGSTQALLKDLESGVGAASMTAAARVMLACSRCGAVQASGGPV